MWFPPLFFPNELALIFKYKIYSREIFQGIIPVLSPVCSLLSFQDTHPVVMQAMDLFPIKQILLGISLMFRSSAVWVFPICSDKPLKPMHVHVFLHNFGEFLKHGHHLLGDCALNQGSVLGARGVLQQGRVVLQTQGRPEPCPCWCFSISSKFCYCHVTYNALQKGSWRMEAKCTFLTKLLFYEVSAAPVKWGWTCWLSTFSIKAFRRSFSKVREERWVFFSETFLSLQGEKVYLHYFI